MTHEEKKQRLENYRYLVLEKDSLIQSSDTYKQTSTSIIVIENDKSKNALRSKPSIIEIDSKRIKEIDIELQIIRYAINKLKNAKYSCVLREYYTKKQETCFYDLAIKLDVSERTVARRIQKGIELLELY